MMRIVQLCHYPTHAPVTGGERRARNIARMLGVAGYEVADLHLSYASEACSDAQIGLKGDVSAWIWRLPHAAETRLSDALVLDERIFNRLGDALGKAEPDCIWLEHPFLWPAIDRMQIERPVVYSAHNVEWKLKADTLKGAGFFDPLCIHKLRTYEEDLARKASLVVCCSEEDARYFRGINENVLIMPNGADPPRINDKDEALRELGAANVAAPELTTFCYISAQFEPNWFGLRDLLLAPLNESGQQERFNFFLIGGICHLFNLHAGSFDLSGSNIFKLPNASENLKDYALLNSDVILLPMTHGGGTNLKTAEALLTGKRIIATSTAFRGFEEYKSLANVQIADTPDQFVRAVRNASQSDKTPAAMAAPDARLGALTWDKIIADSSREISSRLKCASHAIAN